MAYQQHPQAYQPERPQHHGRTRSTFSFTSNKSGHSDHSSGSKPKVENLIETEAEKQRQRFKPGTRANPNTAIQELQPMALAQEGNTIGSLRSLQLKDYNGNPIVDPDASNPSRPRMERPLDTIRSFEAAIDKDYKRREQVSRTEPADAARDQASRRNSMYGNGHETPMNQRYSPGNGYNDSRHARQPTYDQYHQQQQGQSNYMQRQRPRGPGQSLPPVAPEPGVYPNHTYQDSNDTFQTGYSSGSQSEQWANSTDPTSDSGSVDRMQGHRNGDPHDAYGDHWRGSPVDGTIMEEHAYNNAQNYQPQSPGSGQRLQRTAAKPGNNQAYSQQQPQQPYAPSAQDYQKPLPSPHHDYRPSQSSNYGRQSVSQDHYRQDSQVSANNKPFSKPLPPVGRAQMSPVGDEKRKSWLKRRFSRD